ncbi:MAG: hypothetical protein WAS49_05455 [Candidatus Dechloromonas phosphoritropha]|jgi:hypothetical protein|nr:hypothetical protein [Candidatus Dechloromonas phosphoritropha]MBP8789117.1 hypothetical protein [Azonexus sp.]MBP9229465.1 hypothetical protein [Azonexus sp.]
MPFFDRAAWRIASARECRHHLTAFSIALSLGVAGCAPDAIRPERPYDAFLNRVQNNCGELPLGLDVIDTRVRQQDPYFLDLTSRYFNGLVSRQNFVEGLESFYNAPPDSPSIRCILQQMPAPGSPPPLSVPPIIR